VPAYVETCPFCPGNESNTPNELLRFPAQESKAWSVRVIPNKFAARPEGCGWVARRATPLASIGM